MSKKILKNLVEVGVLSGKALRLGRCEAIVIDTVSIPGSLSGI